MNVRVRKVLSLSVCVCVCVCVCTHTDSCRIHCEFIQWYAFYFMYLLYWTSLDCCVTILVIIIYLLSVCVRESLFNPGWARGGCFGGSECSANQLTCERSRDHTPALGLTLVGKFSVNLFNNWWVSEQEETGDICSFEITLLIQFRKIYWQITNKFKFCIAKALKQHWMIENIY